MPDIAQRIGISTHFLPSTHGETLEDAIRMVAEAGFGAFELVPVEWQAQIGWPHNIPNVGCWMRELSPDDRRRLREQLSAFPIRTVHSMHLDVSIASPNRGIRDESLRQYRECLQLAVDLDAPVVTSHCAGGTWGYQRDPEELIEAELGFGREMVAFARDHGLQVGYEVTASFERLKRVLDEVEGLGLNFDIGHAAMSGPDPMKWLQHFAGRIVEVHFNAVCHYWGRFMEHVPVNRNNVLDYNTLLPAIRDSGFEGPIICELQGNDIAQVIQVCREAREMIVGIWKDRLRLEGRWYTGVYDRAFPEG